MTLEDLFLNSESPLTEEQKRELQEEYFLRINELKEQISTLQRENNEIARQNARMKEEGNAAVNKATACVESVKAMLQHSKGAGATHRMRDFYCDAMVKYIDNILGDLMRTNICEEFPF